jgi:hypothetical protein
MLNFEITAQDFEHLFDTAMEWRGYAKDWGKQVSAGRFDPTPSLFWRWAYWTKLYTEVVMMRSFLKAKEYKYQCVFDEMAHEWVVLTDYDFREGKNEI